MPSADRQAASKMLHPVRQKVRVYNPNLLSEVLLEVEKARAQQVNALPPAAVVCSCLKLVTLGCAAWTCPCHDIIEAFHPLCTPSA